jgi:D-methionine transport system ATP-binding protein
MIILRHLNKTYNTSTGSVIALQDINLQVRPGEIFGIIGRSGAGKSTLIRCVNLLERASSGEVIIDGQNITSLTDKDLRSARHKMGMIFQHFNLLTTRTVFQNIALPLEFLRTPPAEIKRIVSSLLDLIDLSDKKEAYPAQLSGGQKQRVAIARALTCQPKVLLCDEATSSLDPETTENILQLIQNIRDQLNLAILLITHEMSVIKNCCDRVGILENGLLIEDNAVSDFFAYPKTELAQNFVFNDMCPPLPAALKQHVLATEGVDTHPLVRLIFRPDTASKPIISQMMHTYQLQINILQGNIEFIKNHAMGMMLITLAGEPTQITACLLHLQNIAITIEIIGHVPNNIIAFT